MDQRSFEVNPCQEKIENYLQAKYDTTSYPDGDEECIKQPRRAFVGKAYIFNKTFESKLSTILK